MTHPSFFALDAHALDPRDQALEAHLGACPRCRAHVAALRQPAPFPAALEGLVPEAPRAWPWWRLLGLGLAAAAVLLSLALLATRERPQAVTAKGTPTAVLWLHRAGRVTAWNGQPLHAGDSLRIEVAPAGLTHVTVFDEQARAVLYEARVPPGVPTLTPAWQFDGQAASESLRVVLSRGPLGVEALESASCATDAVSHCTRFTLTRESP